MRCVTVGVLFFWLFTAAVLAAPEWVRTYNGPGNGNDEVAAVATDAVGNVYVCGWSIGATTGEDWVTIKYNLAGDSIWTRRYSGPGNFSDRPAALAVDQAGNVYVTGRSYLDGSNDFYTIKYSANGTEQWARSYHGVTDGDDYAVALALRPSGVAVAGTSVGSVSGYDYAVIAYDAAGNTDWVRRFDGSLPGAPIADDKPIALAVDASGHIIVTGSSEGNTGIDDYLTIRYTPIGNIAWSRRYAGPAGADRAVDITVDPIGHIIVTGTSLGVSSSMDYFTVKYDSDGDTSWTRRYAGPGNCDHATCEDNAVALAVADDGSIYVTGFSHQDLTTAGDDFDIATVAYGSSGTQLWVRAYNGAANLNDWGQDVAVGPNGNVYVTGSVHDPIPSVDAVVLAYSPNGDSVMLESYDSGDHLEDRAVAIAVDDSGNVIAGSSTERNATGWDILIMKYRAQSASSCCQGTTGNVNMQGIVDLSDLSLLIRYLTLPGTVLPCVDEANVNAADIIDLSDLALLISYLVASDIELPLCP